MQASRQNNTPYSRSVNDQNKIRNVNAYDRSSESIDEKFNQTYAKNGIQPISLDDRKGTGKQIDKEFKQEVNRPQRQYSPGLSGRSSRTTSKQRSIKTSKKATAKDKATVRTLNVFIRSFGILAWSTFQLIFVFLSVVFIALAASSSSPAPSPSALVEATKGPVDAVIEAGASAIATVTGASYIAGQIQELASEVGTNTFLLFHFVVIMFGLANMIGVYLIYRISSLEPLSGGGHSLKIAVFILAMIGYSLPLFNLFPWFLPWTFVVQKYPR